jgi:sortase A
MLSRKKKKPEDLSVEELRQLLIDKRRSSRQGRLEKYRRTGRVVTLASDLDEDSLEMMHSSVLTEFDGDMDDKPRERTRRVLDGFLLIVEIVAVLGLVFVLFNGLDVIRQLNQEMAQALEQPTLTPTPLIQAVVLPSGHTPPIGDNVVRPNDAEIPEHLRPLVQSLANIPIPTPGPAQANRIQIPAIGIDAPVVQGDGWEQLKKGVGQRVGSANPGEKGNLVLSAHNDIFGEIFRFLDQLNPGDEVVVFTNQRVYVYVITRSRILEPTDISVMEATADPTITLISCYPYLVDDQRIVVEGQLKTTGG